MIFLMMVVYFLLVMLKLLLCSGIGVFGSVFMSVDVLILLCLLMIR